VTRVVDALAEDEARALVVVGDEDEERDDDRDAEDVPADRDVVERRGGPVAEDVKRTNVSPRTPFPSVVSMMKLNS
jgi:hypothetical protein